jgi:hypothetical protein
VRDETGVSSRGFFASGFHASALIALLAATFLPHSTRAAEGDAEPDEFISDSDRQEWWIPADKVGTVLKDYPRAVLLSRAQYEKLLQDAGPRDPKAPKPPQEAALVSAQYVGKVEGKVLTVQGELVAEVLSGEWARVPLRLGALALAEVKVDGDGALALPPAPVSKANAQPAQQAQPQAQMKGKAAAPIPPAPPPAPESKNSTLLLRGRGKHKITVHFAAPISTTDAWHGANLTLPIAGATSLVVNFPAHTLAECKQPLRTETLPDATRVTIALPLDSGDVALRWRSSGGGLVALPPSLRSNTGFQVDAESVTARSDLTVSTATGTLPETLDFTLAADARMVELTGSDVAGWTAEGKVVHVSLPPGRGARAEFTTVVQRPTALTPAGTEVLLPLPELVGAGRVEGEFTVVGGPGVAMRETAPTPGATPLAPVPGTAGHWRFVGPQVTPKIRVERLRPRFYADLDTLVDFQPDAIYLERTVTLHPEEGGVFNLLLTLPKGEEVLEVRAVNPPVPVAITQGQARAQAAAPPQVGADPLWRVEAGKLSLRWLTDPLPGRPRTVRVKTRTEPAGWAAGVGRTAAAPARGAAAAAAETLLFPVAEMTIEGAEKVSGYLALRASENFRLETEAADMLEPRDGRTTPVTGIYAWFRRGAFDLKVRVTRRPSELLATLTGYALPLAGVLDLHAQIVWDIRYSGVRSVQVRVPEKQADAFHFDGPQIAERTLAGDVWTIVFQKELTGRQTLAVTAKIPVTRAADDASRFSTTVPVIEPLNTQRGSGTWVVEANTDTEIQLTAKGMNELDALLAPPLEGYQPRHRVIGVFTWLGPKYELSLSGVRHAGAGVLTTVVDSMDLTSVLATTGIVRSEAVLRLRTAGAQFFDVTLPAGARLLSLLVDGEPSKPVEGLPGHVRVQLAAKQDNAATTVLGVLFEQNATPEWKARGQSKLAPLRLPPDVPVLKTTWRTYLPEGYYYEGATNNLSKAPKPWERPLLLTPITVWQFAHVIWSLPSMSLSSSSGIADPRARATPIVRPGEAKIYNRLGRLLGGDGPDLPEDFSGELKEMPVVEPYSVSEPYSTAGKVNISPNAIDALLFGVDGTSSPKPAVGALSGVFTDPQFQMKIQAQKQAKDDATSNYFDKPRFYTQFDRELDTKGSNKTSDPKLRARVEEVKQLFVEARAFYDAARYDLANKRCEQVLNLDPYNIAARKLQEQINKKKEEYAKDGETKARSLAQWQVNKSWDRPVRKFGDGKEVEQDQTKVSKSGDGLVTREWKIPPGFLSAAPSSNEFTGVKRPRISDGDDPTKGSGAPMAKRLEAKDYLAAAGIPFPEGAEAVFDPATSSLVVKNRPENLAAIDQIVEGRPPGQAANLPVSGAQARKVGLLPMRLDLPRVGEELVVQGFGAPEQMEVRYFAEADRSRRHRWIFLLGAMGYLCFGGRHPWWRAAWVALALTAIPLVLWPASTATCNLLLGGWLVALVVGRLARRFIFNARTEREVAA